MIEAEHACPCGSAEPFSTCCAPWLVDDYAPPRAEQLMRSRYCAFARGDRDYLLRTWHPSTRPERLQLEADARWFGLHIIAVEAGGPEDSEGWVEFSAKFRGNDRLHYLHERSRFVRQDGRWLYVDGEIRPQAEGHKIGRNAPCPCGSGKKYKRCCG